MARPTIAQLQAEIASLKKERDEARAKIDAAREKARLVDGLEKENDKLTSELTTATTIFAAIKVVAEGCNDADGAVEAIATLSENWRDCDE